MLDALIPLGCHSCEMSICEYSLQHLGLANCTYGLYAVSASILNHANQTVHKHMATMVGKWVYMNSL